MTDKPKLKEVLKRGFVPAVLAVGFFAGLPVLDAIISGRPINFVLFGIVALFFAGVMYSLIYVRMYHHKKYNVYRCPTCNGTGTISEKEDGKTVPYYDVIR